MKKVWMCAIGLGALLLTSACTNNDAYVAKLRAAVAEADVTLVETVALAETEAETGAAVRAALLVDSDPIYSVRAVDVAAMHRYHFDLRGNVLEKSAVGTGSGLCNGSISLVEALTVAEKEAGGVAVAIVPDDDVSCAFEVQVLTPDTLWEVKVSKQGEVLESEESDEDGTED